MSVVFKIPDKSFIQNFSNAKTLVRDINLYKFEFKGSEFGFSTRKMIAVFHDCGNWPTEKTLL